MYDSSAERATSSLAKETAAATAAGKLAAFMASDDNLWRKSLMSNLMVLNE